MSFNHNYGVINEIVVDDDNDKPKIKVYKKRWLILLIFSLNSMANAVLFTCITSINNIVCRYYDVDPEFIDWASNSFTLVFILISLPSALFMTLFGLRKLVLIGSTLNAICTCLHFAGVHRDGIYFVMTGQIIAGFSVGVILQVPPRLSTIWFPEHEHTKATSIAMAFNVIGLGIGFLQPSYTVPNSLNPNEIYNGLYYMYLSHLVFLLICLVLVYLFFEEKPPYPPSYAAAMISKSPVDNSNINVPSFKQSMKIMATDKNFLILTIAFGLYNGTYNFFTTCLNEMVSHIVKTTDIGWIGFSSNIVAMVSILMFSTIVDKKKCYQVCSLILTFGSVICWTLFTLVLLHWKTRYGIYLSFGVLSFFAVPFFVICIEYIAEMTYPIPEGLSSSVILILGALISFLFVYFLGDLIDKGKLALVCYIFVGVYILVFLMVCAVKQRLKRHNVEVNHEIFVESNPSA